MTMNKDLPLILLIAVVIWLIYRNVIVEGYDTRTNWLEPEKDDYYSWRAFGPTNFAQTSQYPWNRQPRPHFARVNYQVPEFYNKGHGQL